MVFGNNGDDSGSGVAFSRDEVTGATEASGDFIVNAQGEDVVSGRTQHARPRRAGRGHARCHAQLMAILRTLEKHYRDMPDAEFTIEDGQLFMLQTRMIPLVDYEQELEIMRELVVRIGDEQGLKVGGGLHRRDDEWTAAGVLSWPTGPPSTPTSSPSAPTTLTQTALGFSRDDVESKFVPASMERKILDRSPFETIDKPGVGWLVRLAAREGREAHPGLKLGICGEHGGDPESIEFFHLAGLDYVSYSPYRVPIARGAAALAAIQHADQSDFAARGRWRPLGQREWAAASRSGPPGRTRSRCERTSGPRPPALRQRTASPEGHDPSAAHRAAGTKGQASRCSLDGRLRSREARARALIRRHCPPRPGRKSRNRRLARR